jgi:hypothetical protein
MKALKGSELFVDVVGLAGHKVKKIPIVTAQSLICTHKGDAIATFHQWHFWGQARVSYPVFRWKLRTQILMIVHDFYLVGHKGY